MQLAQGIFLQMNDHHGLDVDGKPLSSAAGASVVARQRWGATYEQTLAIFDRLLSLASADSGTI
jgi:hypothetical protein